MIWLNNLMLLVIGLAFVVLSLGFVLVITRNVQQGRVFRQRLAYRIEHLRMSRMLRALGIDLSAYLHQVPTREISASAKRCENCSTTNACDDKLQQDTLDPDEIGFCPNQDDLAHFRQVQKPASDN